MLGSPISETSLDDCKLLVVVMPGKRYADEELKHVRTFIERGGSLLILGGNGGLDSLPLGIRLQSREHAVYGPNWFPKVNDMIDHPITRGVMDVSVEAGRALEVRPPAVVLGRSGADTW